jgi:hypothetical protein
MNIKVHVRCQQLLQLTTERILATNPCISDPSSRQERAPVPIVPFLIVSAVLLSAPTALSFFGLRRAGRAAIEARAQDAGIASAIMDAARSLAFRSWLAALALSFAALAFFLHSFGSAGLVVWTVGFLPALICMMFTMLALTPSFRGDVFG